MIMRHRIDVIDASRVYELPLVDVRGHAMMAEPMYESAGQKLYIGVPKSPVVWKYGLPIEMPSMADTDGTFLKALGWSHEDRSRFRRVTMYFVQLNFLDWEGSYEAILSLPCESTHVLVLANYRAASMERGGFNLEKTRQRSQVEVFGKTKETDERRVTYTDFGVVRLNESMKRSLQYEVHRLMNMIASHSRRWERKMATFYAGHKEVAWRMNELTLELGNYGWRTVFYQYSMDVVVPMYDGGVEREVALNFRFSDQHLRVLEDLIRRGDEALAPVMWMEKDSGDFPLMQGMPSVSWYCS